MSYPQDKYGCIDFKQILGNDIHILYNHFTIPFNNVLTEDIACIRLNDKYFIDIGSYYDGKIRIDLIYSSGECNLNCLTWGRLLSKLFSLNELGFLLNTSIQYKKIVDNRPYYIKYLFYKMCFIEYLVNIKYYWQRLFCIYILGRSKNKWW